MVKRSPVSLKKWERQEEKDKGRGGIFTDNSIAIF
jgi:hypothetical protein